MPPARLLATPPRPVVASVASDESVLVRLANDVLQPRIVVTIGLAVGLVVPSNVEIQFRRVGDQVWTRSGGCTGSIPAIRCRIRSESRV